MQHDTEPNLCRVTLVGPAGRDERKGLLKLRPWTKPQWRRLVVEIQVGTERWPDWDSANVCMSAITDLIKMSDGYITDEVFRALQTHVTVVRYETFQGPPR